ncbi:response regulator transcription factor [Flindersiella endophytica]
MRDGESVGRADSPNGANPQRALRVMVAEDDVAIADPLARALRREGYTVELTPTGEIAIDRTASGEIDLLVLDLGLPDIDGLEVCRQLRKDGSRVPVLVLTARADEVDTVVGLDAGADDYVTKPFRLAELLARVRALLRRNPPEPAAAVAESSGAPDAVVDRHGVRIDPQSRRAWLNGDELHLTAKEFDLLRVLHRDAGKVVTREQLMNEVWETTWWSSTKTLDMHISWLRRKLGDDASKPRYIATVRGVGFRFETDPSNPSASSTPSTPSATS